ncbi:MAG: ABC transporter permease [Tissierellia bacterium]|nr:ABC transporter permease [Tissierellia bacterium]
MKTKDLIAMAVRNLLSRKLRTFLTILGVVIGTTAIIVMLSLGIGMTESVVAMYSSWGDLTSLEVYSGWDEKTGKELKLDDKLVKKLEEIPNVKAVSPTLSKYVTFRVGRMEANLNLVGVKPELMEDLDLEVDKGRTLKNNDEFNLVFGSETKNYFHNPKSRSYTQKEVDVMKGSMEMAIAKETFMDYGMGGAYSLESADKDADTFPVKVVGVLKSGSNMESGGSAYMNFDYMVKFLKDLESKKPSDRQDKDIGKYYSGVKIKANEMEDIKDIKKIVDDMGYYSFGLTSMIDEMKDQMKIFQAIFGGIGAISLLVAAIGITNTMIMSIYERTREIGVMKVIGASIKDIQRLFLVEAAFIGLLGGIFGVLLSYAFSFLLNVVLGSAMTMGMGMGMGDTATKISIIPIWLVLVALAFSASIGLISGYFPARRAMKLSALDAIRTE